MNMTKKIVEHEGKKYLRRIRSCVDQRSIDIDVYDVLVAFNVTCPARGQAIKKLLCAGLRGKGDVRDDLKGAEAAVARAIDLQINKMLDEAVVIANKLSNVCEKDTATWTVKTYTKDTETGEDIVPPATVTVPSSQPAKKKPANKTVKKASS
jgi:secreted trypsin-like serine protease